MKFDKALISGSTSLLLLKLLSEQDMYGYQMIEELDKRSQNVFTLKAGTLYPILHALEQQGMVESYEQLSQNARPRIYYRILPRGKELFEEKKTEWAAYTSLVDRVLGGMSYAVYAR